MKFAKKIANVVTYLHIKFPWPIIYREKNPADIFLNQHHASKLFNFNFAMSINEGESRVGLDDLAGTVGFIDPDYMIRSFVTEKTDVFSFGVPLLVLLTGRNAFQPEMSLTEYVKDLF